MDLKIIGASFGRTGTLSLKTALQQLGYGPCLHMSQFVAEGELCRRWLAELRSGEPDWHNLIGDFHSVVDWPGCLFVEPLLVAMPDVKVIYTERDFDGWYRSVSDTIFPALHWARHIPPERRPAFFAFVEEIIGNRTFSGSFGRASARQLYLRHRQAIVDLVPAEQLLLFDIRQGWGSLCEFLGVPEPKGTFPKENASGEFFALLGQMRRGQG